MKFQLPKVQFRMHPHTQLLTFGAVIPTILVWAAHWLVFGISQKLATIEKFLTDNSEQITAVLPDFKLPGYFSDVLFKLNVNQGILYVILGILVFTFSVVLFFWLIRRYEAENIGLGQIRFKSVIVSLIIGLVLVSLLMAILNQLFIYVFPAELMQIFWP